MARLTEKTSAEQIARLSALAYYPTAPQGARELASTLRSACETEDHARAVIDTIIERFEACPSPADIRRVAQEFITPATPHSGCRYCDGSGWIIYTRVLPGIGGRPQEFSAAKACSCWAGRVA